MVMFTFYLFKSSGSDSCSKHSIGLSFHGPGSCHNFCLSGHFVTLFCFPYSILLYLIVFVFDSNFPFIGIFSFHGFFVFHDLELLCVFKPPPLAAPTSASLPSFSLHHRTFLQLASKQSHKLLPWHLFLKHV